MVIPRDMHQLTEALRRIEELEDTIDLEEARHGLNKHAKSVIAEIEARRGANWPGAKTIRQQTAVVRSHKGDPYCKACKWFHPQDAHDPVCALCDCAHEYHNGPSGQCTNGAPGWSCDCTKYTLPTTPKDP